MLFPGSKVTSIFGIVLVLAISSFAGKSPSIAESRKCADPECVKPIGTGRTVLRYRAKDRGMLSFNVDQKVTIFSKGSGQKGSEEFWEVQINGQRGFANQRYIQEMKVIVKEPTFDVPFVKKEPEIDQPKETEQQPDEMQPKEPELQQPQEVQSKEPELQQPQEVQSKEPELQQPQEVQSNEPEQEVKPVIAKAESEQAVPVKPDPEIVAPVVEDLNKEAEIVPQNIPEAAIEAVPESEVVPDDLQKAESSKQSLEQQELGPDPATQGTFIESVPETDEASPTLSDPNRIPGEEPLSAEQTNNNNEPPKLEEEVFGGGEELLQKQFELPVYVEDRPSDEDERQEQVEVPIYMEEEVVQEHSDGEEKKSDFEETVEHYVEASENFLPGWLVHILYVGNTDQISPQLVLVTSLTVVLLVLCYSVFLLTDQCSREGTLKERLGKLEQELFKVKNESQIIKREAEEALSKGGGAGTAQVIYQEAEPPKHLIDENENLKADNSRLLENLNAANALKEQEITELNDKMVQLQQTLDEKQKDLEDAEKLVQECLEEKRNHSQKSSSSDLDLSKAIESLRTQLGAQQQSVAKYDAKIKKRESELKIKTQELRKQRADTANAKLEFEKLTKEHEVVKKRLQELDSTSEEKAKVQQELEEMRQKYFKLCEESETKESELEAKVKETEVLKETLEQLKNFASANQKESSESNEEGWDCEDDIVTPDLATIMDQAELKVELRKAQEVCEKLSEQLTAAEASRDEFEAKLNDFKQDVEVSRKAKENSVNERVELEKKLMVLTTYFNQREAELQKQLGMTANRLTDTATSSESAVKQLVSLQEEVESYKSQIKILKKDMEEQERSLKAQNAALEKKQHESWVTVRQESRRSAEAQTEMQTLRTRLTTVESKLVQKEFEISSLKEENESLRETVEQISRASHPKSEPVYTNGNGSAASSTHGGPITPPDLPPLPLLPSLMPMAPLTAAPPGPPFLPPDVRPAPLGGRRSPPPPRGYSPSSPPTSDDYYDRSYRNGDLPPGERSRRYDHDNRYDRYSRDRSIDRMSNRSGRSDRSRHYD